MPAEQSAANHTRFDPMFHFTLIPILLVNLGLSIYYTIHQWPIHSRSHLWWIVLSVIWILMLLKSRLYALENQNRIIRLEERIRYAMLLTPEQNSRAADLSLQQIIALRFASDAELPALLSKTLSGNMDPKQIKAAITTWRPDHHRV